MDIPDSKALKQLLKILRENGVLQYNSTDLQLVLSEAPATQTRIKSLAEETMEDIEEELSPEQEIEKLIQYNDIHPKLDE